MRPASLAVLGLGLLGCSAGAAPELDGELMRSEEAGVEIDASPGDAGSRPRDAAGDAAGDAAAPDAARAPWLPFANGLTRRAAGPGSSTLVVYGGWRAEERSVQAWADALHSGAFAARGVGVLYAARGPVDTLYRSPREIENSALSRALPSLAGRLTLIAHSSGAYVAEELLGQLGPGNAVLARTDYFVLDGAARDLAPLASSLSRLRFVHAFDPGMPQNNGLSRNAAAMTSAASSLTTQGATSFRVVATGSGCRSADCLHDAVIIRRPYDPLTFDLARDYALFTAERPLVLDYLE